MYSYKTLQKYLILLIYLKLKRPKSLFYYASVLIIIVNSFDDSRMVFNFVWLQLDSKK